METSYRLEVKSNLSNSLLAREINWMETLFQSFSDVALLINSLLAREINWMETFPAQWDVKRKG